MTEREKTATEELKDAEDLALEIISNPLFPPEVQSRVEKISGCIERATRRIGRIRSEIVCSSEDL
jgi:hypothetical protein